MAGIFLASQGLLEVTHYLIATMIQSAGFVATTTINVLVVLLIAFGLNSGLTIFVRVLRTKVHQVRGETVWKIKDWTLIMFFVGVSGLVYAEVMGSWVAVSETAVLSALSIKGESFLSYALISILCGILGLLIVGFILAFPVGYLVSMKPLVSGFLVCAIPELIHIALFVEDWGGTSWRVMLLSISEIIFLPVIFWYVAMLGTKLRKPFKNP